MVIVATGYVRLQVLSNTLASQVKKAVEDAVKGLDDEFDNVGNRAGKKITEGMEDSLKEDEDVQKEARKMGNRVRDQITEGTGENLEDKVANVIRRGFAEGSKDSENQVIEVIVRSTKRATEKASRESQSSFKDLWKKGLKPMAVGLGSAFGGFIKGALVYAAPEVLSWAAGMGASLGLSVIPAVQWLGQNGAALMAGFYGTMASLLTSTNLLKLALKQDTEAMKAFNKEWEELAKTVGLPVQEEFLARTGEGMNRLRSLAKDLEPELRQIGAAWGDAFDQFSVMLRNENGAKNIASILKTSEKTTRDFGTAATNLGDAFLTVLAHMAPIINYISEGAAKFGMWVNTIIQMRAASGQLDGDIARILARIKQTWAIIKNFGQGILNIFKASSPVANQFGEAMLRISERFKDWTSKPENMDRMTKAFQKAYDISAKIMGILGDIAVRAGRAFEKMDQKKIEKVLDIIQTRLLPAVIDLFNQFKGNNSDEWLQTFDNLSSTLQKMADSGMIETVGNQVSDLSTYLSNLASTDSGSWALGLAAALIPLAGALPGIVSGLQGIYYAIGSLRLSGLFGGGGSGGGGGGGAGGSGGFFSGAKGLLRGGIIAFVAGEILSIASDDFSDAWGDMWSAVFGGVGTALGKSLELIGDGLAVPTNWLASIVHSVFGDEQAAREATARAGAAWDEFKLKVSEIDTWFGDRASRGEIEDLQSEIFGKFDGKAFTEATQILSEGIGKLSTAGQDLGQISPMIEQSWTGISNMLSRSPIPDDLKTKVASQWADLIAALATGNQDLGTETGAIEATLRDLELLDPSFKPVADKIRQEMGLVTRLIPEQGERWNDAWNSVNDNLQKIISNEDFTGSFQEWGLNLQSEMDNLKTTIETGGDISQPLAAVFARLKEVKPGDPQAVIDTRNSFVAALSAMGYDVAAAGFEIPAELNRAFIEGAAKVGPQAVEALAAIPRDSFDAMMQSIQTSNFTEAAAILSQGLAGLPAEVRKNTVDAVTAGQSWGPELAAAMQGSFDPALFAGLAEKGLAPAVAELQKMPAEMKARIEAATSSTDIAQAFGGWLSTIPPTLQSQAVTAAAAANIIPQEVADSLIKGFAQIPGQLGPMIGQINAVEGVNLDGMKSGINVAIQGVVAAINSGQTDISAQVKNLAKAFEGADVSFEPMRQQIVTSLQAAGVDVATLAPTLLTPLTAALDTAQGEVGQKAQGISSTFGAGLGQLTPEAQARISEATGVITSGLGTTLPSAVAATGPALGNATRVATSAVPTAAMEQFLLANQQAGTTASLMPQSVATGLAGVGPQVTTSLAPISPAANAQFALMNASIATQTGLTPGVIAPGLESAVGAVGTTLAPVPATGAAPFSALGSQIGTIAGGFAKAITPGLNNAADQPPTQFAPIPKTGLAPWVAMSAAVLGALNAMNISVARVMAAVAAVVVASWQVIGAANATGLAGTMAAVSAVVAGAALARVAQNTVLQVMIDIARMMVQIREAVVSAKEARDQVAGYAADAANALIAASRAASQAAVASASAAAQAANAAASRSAAAAAVPAAEGGVFSPAYGGTLTLIAEAGRSERVEPLDRNGLSVRDKAMVDYLIGGNRETGGDVHVSVFIGDQELTDIVDSRVARGQAGLARQLINRRRIGRS